MTNFWRDRPTLVTGATGLVGGSVVRRLLSAGADVVCLVRDWAPDSEFVAAGLYEKVKTARGDLRDLACMDRVVAEYEIDAILHLGAQTIVPIANRSPISTFESNIAGTWNVLEAARRNRTVRQIVLASSDKAYGEAKTLPYDEETPLIGRHPYDVSKSCADLIAQAYAATYGTPVAVTRCGNFYGGGDLNWSRIIPGTIRSVLRGQRPVIRSDGQSIRDYFYVEDGAAAYLLLAERLAADPALVGQAFNFSNEEQMSALEVVRTVLAVMQSRLEPEVRNEASNEIRRQSLSANKARMVLGWRPLFTMQQGLAATVEWYRRYFDAIRPMEVAA